MMINFDYTLDQGFPILPFGAQFGGNGLPGCTYLEPKKKKKKKKNDLVLLEKRLVFGGSTLKIEDKQVPGTLWVIKLP